MECVKQKIIKNNFGDCNLQNSCTTTKVESLTKDSLNYTACDLAHCPNDTRCAEIIDSAKTYGKCVPLPTTASPTTTKTTTQTRTTLSTKRKYVPLPTTAVPTTTKATTQTTTTLSTRAEKLKNDSTTRNNTNMKSNKKKQLTSNQSKSSSKNTC